MVALLAGCGSAAPHPNTEVVHLGAPIPLTSLHMVSREVGWGRSDSSCALRTTDGGRSFTDVSPVATRLLQSPDYCVFQALGANRAWALRIAPNQTATVFSTSDGGKHWTKEPPLAIAGGNGGSYVDFLDAAHGWLETVSSSGECTFPSNLYETEDAGAHWSKVPISRPATHQASLFGGPIRFVSETAGWLAGQSGKCNDQRGPTSLYRTIDGGQHWEYAPLPVPTQYAAGPIRLGAPLFFDSNTGILPVQFGAEVTSVYRTDDGGLSWQFQVSVPSSGSPSFVDSKNGWVSDGINLYETRDGGHSWAEIPPDQTMAKAVATYRIHEIDFVSRSYGWALLSAADPHESVVLVTRDAGRTWTSPAQGAAGRSS